MHKSEKKRCFSSATFSQLKMKSQIFAWLGGDFLAWWLFLGLVAISWLGIAIPRSGWFSPHAQKWKS